MLSVLQRTGHSIQNSNEKIRLLVIVITIQIKTTDYGDFQLKKCYFSTISKLLLWLLPFLIKIHITTTKFFFTFFNATKLMD